MKTSNKLREKILKGIKLAIEKLILVSQQNNDYLVLWDNGKIVKVKASSLKKKK